MYEVTVYYNDNVMAMMQGYHKDDPMKYVCTYAEEHDVDVHACAQRAFSIMQEPENMPTVRSMSVGDVIRIRRERVTVWLACASMSWTLIDMPYVIGTWSK